MAAVTRQPFAPLDGARLQSLTSMKNRQNAICASPGKRKASDSIDADDFENVDPTSLFSKRSKGSLLDGFSTKDYFKPSNFVLTKASSAPSIHASKDVSSTFTTSPVKPTTAARHRSILNPKSPTAKLNTSLARNSLSAPAGRSPTRGSKRIGILNRHRTGRVDPPTFNLSPAPFSLDAALKGTVPSYASHHASSSKPSTCASHSLSGLHEADMSSSWFFDIHEDTPEQEMTNLLQHSTCTLDISSDEESEQKIRRERAEGRDKENIPPPDDISQTSARRSARRHAAARDPSGMDFEKPRHALGDLDIEAFYAEGCDPSSVFIVPGDDEDGTVVGDEQQQQHPIPVEAHKGVDAKAFEFAPEVRLGRPGASTGGGAEALMGRAMPSQKAAVLEPMEGTGESFELWESGSAKDEGERARSPSPVPASPSSDTTEILGYES